MILKTSFWSSALLLAFASQRCVVAGVVDANDHPHGLGKRAILDEGTRLLWLDLGYTRGMSFNEVIAQTSPGGEYAGWHPATNQQATQLFQHVGLKLGGPGITLLGPEAPGKYLMEIWGGSTQPSSSFNGANGTVSGRQANFATIDETVNAGEKDFSYYFVSDGNGSIGGVPVSTVLPNIGNSTIAVALVRIAVPEPSTALIVFSIIFPLQVFARRRRPPAARQFG